jgi:hypothetical protein
VNANTAAKSAVTSGASTAGKTTPTTGANQQKYSTGPVNTEAHHSIPKFTGGNVNQQLTNLSQPVHSYLHSTLRANLKDTGIPLNVGGVGGSSTAWNAYMQNNPGLQRSVFDAVLDASRSTDLKFGTSITSSVWHNLINGNFKQP